MSLKISRLPALRVLGGLCIAATALAGCERTEVHTDKGPAEIVGKQLDRAAIEAGREFKEAAHETGKMIEKAGAKIQEKARDAQEAQR